MPDSKITALTSIGTSTDPANDPLVIVDVSDTSMAATGTTKKVTLNQLLATSPTATLASATITGDLTVDTSTLKVDSTNNRVGIGTASPATILDIQSAGGVFARIQNTTSTADAYLLVKNTTGEGFFGINALGPYIYTASALPIVFTTATSERYRIAGDGVATWSNVGGVAGTAMTLNSTGLGVGVTPNRILDVRLDQSALTLARVQNQSTNSAAYAGYQISASGNNWGIWVGSSAANSNALAFVVDPSGTPSVKMTLDTSGNVGVGVTPSTLGSVYRSIEFSRGVSMFAQTDAASLELSCNAYINSSFLWTYKTTDLATHYRQYNGTHQWHNAPSGTAGNAITFTQAMTLDASGNLLVGTTTNTNGSRVFARGTGGATTLAIQSSTGDTANPGLLVGKFDNDSTTSQILVRFTINNNAAGSGQITANGANAAAFGTFSDSRLKENIASIPSQLEKIVSLRPVEFDFKNGSGHQIGFVAQEMQEVYPDVVGEQDGFLTITGWSKTEARLVSAIKELAAKVQALEAKLA